jgi:hypothetical protein
MILGLYQITRKSVIRYGYEKEQNKQGETGKTD